MCCGNSLARCRKKPARNPGLWTQQLCFQHLRQLHKKQCQRWQAPRGRAFRPLKGAFSTAFSTSVAENPGDPRRRPLRRRCTLPPHPVHGLLFRPQTPPRTTLAGARGARPHGRPGVDPAATDARRGGDRPAGAGARISWRPCRSRSPSPARISRSRGGCDDFVAGTDFRITVVAIDGTVLADSDRRDDELAAMDNHRSRPEIAAALARGEGSAVRHSDTTGQDTLYAARLVRNGEGRSWILRLGQPLSTISALNRHLTRILMLAVLALALVALVSWWLTRALFRPLGELLAAADVMGRGDYTARSASPNSANWRGWAIPSRASRATPANSSAPSKRSATTCAPPWPEWPRACW